MEKLSASEVLTNNYTVQVATTEHLHLAEAICHEMEESAKARGTGIAKRSPEYLRDKIKEGKAITEGSPNPTKKSCSFKACE